MKTLLKYTGLLFIFWFIVFALMRLFFVLYQLPISGKIKNQYDLFRSFYEGYKLDIATSTILILLPLSFAILFYASQRNLFKRITSILTICFLLIFILTAVSDAGLYKEWNAKINMQALLHFKNPKEVFSTLSAKLIALFIVFVSIFFIPFYFIYQYKIHPSLYFNATDTSKKRSWYGFLYFLLSVGIGVIFIRGGITNMPINQSVAYFSNDVFANDIAVNPLYNIMQDATIKQIFLILLYTNSEAMKTLKY